MRNLLLKGAKLRFALWVVGQALPEPHQLKPIMNKALVTAIAAGACGMLLTMGLILGVVGVYFYVMQWTGDWVPALWLGAATAIFLALTLFVSIKSALQTMSELPASLKMFKGRGHSIVDDAWNTALSGFLEGILPDDETREEAKKKQTSTAPTHPVSDEDAPSPTMTMAANANQKKSA